jgi:hypothetical protein
MTTPPGPSRDPAQEEERRHSDTSPTATPPAPPPSHPVPYNYPGYPGYPVPGPTNGLAIASLVLGILWIYCIGSILALIFGYIARRQIRERGESGHGLAIAGIVLGWVGVGVSALFIIIFAVIGVMSGHS